MSYTSMIPADVRARNKAVTAQLHASRQPLPTSRRAPHRDRRNNPADMIEEQMQQFGHDTWGYVIYRTTYESDADWEKFLTRLHEKMDDSFEYCNGKDMLQKFTLTVMDNKDLFDTASTGHIRQHFNEWVAQNYASEQPQAKERAEEGGRSGSSRYRYAVCVDAESLHSIVSGASRVPKKKPWVKVIKRLWEPASAEELEGEEPLEPLEGVTQDDVGWVRVELISLITFYEHGADRNYWTFAYQRPPQILSL